MKLKDIVKSITKNSSNGQLAFHPSKKKMKEYNITEEDIMNSMLVKKLNKLGKTNE